MGKLGRRTLAGAAVALAAGAATVTWAATSATAATGGPAAQHQTAQHQTAQHRTARDAAIPRCAPDQLYVWVSPDSGNGAAGSNYQDLDYTNVSKSACRLYSWPGVSARNANGKQLGAAAEREPGVPARYVNIPPNGTAHSVLRYVDVQVTPACKPANATYLKVYPPDDRGSRDAYFPAIACTDKTIYLMIGRVQPGA